MYIYITPVHWKEHIYSDKGSYIPHLPIPVGSISFLT